GSPSRSQACTEIFRSLTLASSSAQRVVMSRSSSSPPFRNGSRLGFGLNTPDAAADGRRDGAGPGRAAADSPGAAAPAASFASSAARRRSRAASAAASGAPAPGVPGKAAQGEPSADVPAAGAAPAPAAAVPSAPPEPERPVHSFNSATSNTTPGCAAYFMSPDARSNSSMARNSWSRLY